MTAPTPPRGRHLRTQAFRDAIDLRRARLAEPCAGCQDAPAGDRCAEHTRDLDWISAYERAARREMTTAPRSLQADARVVAAAELVGQRHNPATMSAGQLRAVLVIHQRRLARLLDAVHVAALDTAGPTPDQVAVAALAVLADDPDGGDFAGRLAAVLASVACSLGSSEALIAARPGSWESDLLIRLVRGTCGWDDEQLADFAVDGKR